jgi:hypothetical protein
MYKILKSVQGTKLNVSTMDMDGDFHFNTTKINYDGLLKKVKIDTFDEYDLEMVVSNSEISIDGLDTISNEHIKLYDEPVKNQDIKLGETATHGVINSNDYFATNKTIRQIKIERDFIPTFYLENYTIKLNIRRISDDNKLLEFYVSKYPDELRLNSKLFINMVKKTMLNNTLNNSFDIKEVGFISNNTLGANDFLCYGYEIIKLDKIVEFDGYYVIKYIAKNIINGEDILSEYIEVELDEKYNNKAVKN